MTRVTPCFCSALRQTDVEEPHHRHAGGGGEGFDFFVKAGFETYNYQTSLPSYFPGKPGSDLVSVLPLTFAFHLGCV